MNSETGLSGKTVLLLGGTSGFGLTVAKLAGQAGAKLILVGRSAEKASSVADAFQTRGTSAQGHGLDAADPKALSDFIERMGYVDHLVSTLGGAMGGGFLSAAAATIRDTIEGKFFVNWQVARVVAPYIRHGGTMTFTAGAGGRPDNASGAILGNQAISTLVRGLAVELAPHLRVNAVSPTWTPTPLWRDVDAADVEATKQRFAQQIPLGRTGEPAEVAQAYMFLMTCGFVTGQTIVVDGGLELIT